MIVIVIVIAKTLVVSVDIRDFLYTNNDHPQCKDDISPNDNDDDNNDDDNDDDDDDDDDTILLKVLAHFVKHTFQSTL